jgi:hypothetical protein
MISWDNLPIEDNRRIFADDWWPYGAPRTA